MFPRREESRRRGTFDHFYLSKLRISLHRAETAVRSTVEWLLLISVNSTSIFILQNYEFPCTAVRRWTIWNRMSCRVTRIDFDLIVCEETHPPLRPSAFHQGRATNWVDVIDLNYGSISWLYSSCIGRRLLDDIDFLHSATSNTSKKKQTE